MLRVTVELLPYGYEKGKRELARMHIGNDGTGDWHTGNYNVVLFGAGEHDKDEPIIETRVEGHDRTQNVWALLKKIFEKI